jgi:hypothetical protein
MNTMSAQSTQRKKNYHSLYFLVGSRKEVWQIILRYHGNEILIIWKRYMV